MFFQLFRWFRSHQKDIRAELYQGLKEAVDNCEVAKNVGKKIILPNSFIGSQRYFVKNYQDAMSIVRMDGKPDLFITMTANPNWPEIINNLSPGETAQDRPDLIVRAFEMRKNELLKDLTKKHVKKKTFFSTFLL